MFPHPPCGQGSMAVSCTGGGAVRHSVCVRCARTRHPGGRTGHTAQGACRCWSGFKSRMAGPSPVLPEMRSPGGGAWVGTQCLGSPAVPVGWPGTLELRRGPFLSCWDRLFPGPRNQTSHQRLALETCSLMRLGGSPRIHPTPARPLLAPLGVCTGGKPLSPLPTPPLLLSPFSAPAHVTLDGKCPSSARWLPWGTPMALRTAFLTGVPPS